MVLKMLDTVIDLPADFGPYFEEEASDGAGRGGPFGITSNGIAEAEGYFAINLVLAADPLYGNGVELKKGVDLESCSHPILQMSTPCAGDTYNQSR